ncbi:MAG: glycoside hydrolase family 88 protein, partial [Prevotella sp.]|nr:glycoside hydrolase family 88 protein [Prevotella sp.]
MKKTFTKQFEWVMGMTGSTSCFSPTRRLLLLLCLILVGVGGTKAQSDVTFNDGVRYSQWVIDSRMNNFYANTTPCGFAVYNQNGTQTSARVDGKTKLDYVVGLVAKSIIEASQYYSQFTWADSFAKPWFLSIQNYGDNFYSKFSTSGGSLDDLNAVKLFIPLRAMTATDGKYPNTKTYGYTTSALDNAITGLNAHNTNYRIKDNNILAKTAGNDVIGGWWHKSTYENQMWLDGAYMGPALFAELVNYSGKTTNIDSSNDWDLIVKQFTILHEMCWNSSDKLPYHAFAADGGTNVTSHSDTWEGLSHTDPYVFHSASYWGRAVGWYFLALVDILEQMDKANLSSSDGYTILKGYLTEIADGLVKRQDKTTGGWYQILDKDGTYSASSYNGKSYTQTNNYIESSATALFTAAYLKAIRLGYLAENDYKTVAVNGYKCLVNNFFSVDENGKVNIFGSCRSAGLGGSGDNYKAGKERYRDGSKEYYLLGYDVAKVEKNENKTEGKVLGAFIMAATEYERQYQSSMLLSKDLNSTYTLNSNESLSVEVLGDGTPAYQWYDANTSNPIEGATNASYTPTKSGKYYCKITVTPPSSPAAKIRAASTSGSYTITTSTANVTVEGAATTYTVTFNAGSNGTCSTESLPQASAGASITLPNVTANAGYTFDGWYTAETGGTKIGGAGETYTPTDNITLYAHYTATGGETSNGVIATFKDATATTWEASEKNGFSISNVTMKSGTGYVKLASKNTITITIPSGYTVTGLNINALCTSSNTNSELTFKNGETSLGTVTISSGQSLGDYNCTLSNNVKGATTITITNSGSKEININTIQVLGYSGTPSTPTGHTITYNFNGHGENTTDNATALPNPLPKPTADGYTFVGWYTDEPLTQEATPGDELTDDVTLYAKWTPITDLFTLTGVKSTTVSVSSKATVEVSIENATITGGSAQLYNGHSDPKDMISSSQINLNGSSASYLKITLDNTLKAGDEIIINPATSSFILKATASTSTTNAKSFTGSYVIQQGDAVVGKNEIYLYKGSNSLIEDINITRYYPESDSRATFTYGSSQLTFTETTEGTYTTTLEVGTNKRGQEISITPTAQDGATIKKDGTTVSGDITITAPSKIGNTDTHTYTVTSKDGSSTTTYIINVKVVKEKITLKYSDRNGNTEWTWNSTTTPTQPTFDQPKVKAYIKNAEGTDVLLEDESLSYTYESDVTSVATVDASSGVITIAKSGNGGAKIYATLKENVNYYADPAFFNVLLEQGYSFSVDSNKTAPAINTSKYITRTTAEGTEEKLVKMTFGGWKWEGYANADATTKTLGSYKVERADKATYYTDKWNDSGGKASDIASIDGHYYSWNGVNDAVDESKAASDKAIYGSIRYGWFKSPVHDNDGKTTESYPYTLPVRGSFMTFEPTMNGTLTIYILQNGAWNTNDDGGTYEQVGDGSITYEKGDIIPGQFRPHAFQVVNQRGLTVQEFSPNYSVSTKQKVDSRYYCMLPEDKDYNQTKYNNPYNVAKWTEFADYMSTEEQKRAHDSWN